MESNPVLEKLLQVLYEKDPEGTKATVVEMTNRLSKTEKDRHTDRCRTIHPPTEGGSASSITVPEDGSRNQGTKVRNEKRPRPDRRDHQQGISRQSAQRRNSDDPKLLGTEPFSQARIRLVKTYPKWRVE